MGRHPVEGRYPRGLAPTIGSPVPTRSVSHGAREWVVEWWGGRGGLLGRAVSMVTFPLELGFRAGSRLRNRLYVSGALPLQRAPVPVISVGNLTVGGSGKTPLSAWLVKGLRARGEKPALVARGYGEDEMVLHRRWNPDALVIAQEDRAYGAWKAARKGASVVVLDDGFQHRRLARELDLVLVAARTPRRVRLLPRGPFREPLSALQRAGVVILTQKGRGEDSLEMERRLSPWLREAPVRVCFTPGSWTDLAGRPALPPDGEPLAVAGIGDPEGFSRVLREAMGQWGELMAFPDHHAYTWQDIQGILARAEGRPLVTTEKDAVRLATFQEDLGEMRVLTLGLEVLDGEERLWRHVTSVLDGGSPTP